MTSQKNTGGAGTAGDPAPSEDLAALLTRVVAAAGITQKQLAEEAGIPYPTLNAWVNGTRGTSRVAPEILRNLVTVVNRHGVALSPGEIFAAAGRAVPGPSDEEREAHLLRLYRQLPTVKQRDLIKDAEAMLAVTRS